MAQELLRELAPLLAEEASMSTTSTSPTLATLQAAMNRTVERHN
jgi:hypothetical protein